MHDLMVFSIFDSKAMAFLQPFFCVNAAVAVRTVERAVNDPNTDFHRFATDYELYQLGTFDSFDGKLAAVDPKIHITALAQLRQQPEGGE